MIGDAAWIPALPPFLIASMVCIVGIPLSVRLARRLGAVAEPDEDRHLHPVATPRLGGVAMFAGFAVSLIIFGGDIGSRWQLLLVCALVTAAMALDDIFDLPWWQKLIVIAGAGVAFFAAGISITFVDLPGGGGGHVLQLGWLALPVTVLWVSGMQVSINFLDGADGVAAGVVGIVAVIAMLAAINRITGPGDVQSGVVILSGALMGCCAGFLVFNLPPARVFMGDSGAHFLGVALAAITIIGIAKVAVGLSILVPLIALGLPISDTAWAIVRRRRAGVSPATPDAGHIHHRLRARGMTPMETALTFYLTTGVLGCLGLAIFGHRRILDVAIGLLVLGLIGVFWRNRRRLGAAARAVPARQHVDPDLEGYISVPGQSTIPARVHHRGEID